jgi:hypothetical protein
VRHQVILLVQSLRVCCMPWIPGLKERVHGVCCMPLDSARGLKARVHGVLLQASRSYEMFKGESAWDLLHAARSCKRSKGESAWNLLHAARSYKRSTVENTRRACFPACLLHATKRLVTEGWMPGRINPSFITPVKLLHDVNFNNLHMFWFRIII